MCKIDKTDQTLLELKRRCVIEQNRLPDSDYREKNAVEGDVIAGTEETLYVEEDCNLRGEEFSVMTVKGIVTIINSMFIITVIG